MQDKLSYYDVVAHVVPGTLVLVALGLVPRLLGFAMPWPQSDVVALAVGLPVVYAIGQVVQAISSMLEQTYFRLWGGPPSRTIMEGHGRRLKGERLERVIDCLSVCFGSPGKTEEQRTALFLDAMALCNKEGLGRVDSFNAAYALHRALLTSGIIAELVFTAALLGKWLGIGAVTAVDNASVTYVMLLVAIGTAIEFVRTRQRGEYFAEEVLNNASIHCRRISAPSEEDSHDV